MSDSDTAASDSGDDGRRQLRLLGVGFVLSGVVTLGLANASDPRGMLVALLGFLGFATLVLEKTQGYTPGVSFGLLSGGIAVWAWPFIRSGDAGFTYLGMLMVVVGIVNIVFARVGLYFRRLGERIGNRTTGKE